MEPGEKCLNPENIRLINEVNTGGSKRKNEISCNKNIGKRIEEWLCRLIHNESPMQWKKNGKQKN